MGPKADGSVDAEVGRLGIDVAPPGGAASTTATAGRWNRVDWHERRKAGWAAVRRSMRSSALAR